MSLLEINLSPSKRELKWFGLLMLLWFGVIGGIVFATTRTFAIPNVLWTVGAVLCITYYAVRPLRKPLFMGWMNAAFPIGWTVSHLILAIVYFVVVTPIGLAMRLFGKNRMHPRLDREADSYWIRHRTGGDTARYFRQF